MKPYVLRLLKHFLNVLSLFCSRKMKRRDLFIHGTLTQRYWFKSGWFWTRRACLSRHFKERRISNGVLDLPCKFVSVLIIWNLQTRKWRNKRPTSNLHKFYEFLPLGKWNYKATTWTLQERDRITVYHSILWWWTSGWTTSDKLEIKMTLLIEFSVWCALHVDLQSFSTGDDGFVLQVCRAGQVCAEVSACELR